MSKYPLAGYVALLAEIKQSIFGPWAQWNASEKRTNKIQQMSVYSNEKVINTTSVETKYGLNLALTGGGVDATPPPPSLIAIHAELLVGSCWNFP